MEVEKLIGTSGYSDGALKFLFGLGAIFAASCLGYYFFVADAEVDHSKLIEISGTFGVVKEVDRSMFRFGLKDDDRTLLISTKGWSVRSVRKAFSPEPESVRVLAEQTKVARSYRVHELELDGIVVRSLDEMIRARQKDDLLAIPMSLVGLFLVIIAWIALRHRTNYGNDL